MKPLDFIAASRSDLTAFPDAVKQDVGYALFVAQTGGRAPSVKVLQGFGGGGVVEIVEDHDGDTYRCVYTTRLKRRFMCCMRSRKNRNAAVPRQNRTLTW